MALQVELVSPEAVVYTGEATMVLARTTDGEIAFQPGHVSFVGALSGKGPVKLWLTDDSVQLVAVHSGFVQVANDLVTILSDGAELSQNIDVARARAARESAQAALAADAHDEDAEARLLRAELRLLVAGADASAHGGRGSH